MSFLNHIKLVLLISGILSIFSGCVLENASAPKKQRLIIGSDFLRQSDSLLFKPFEERHNIKVRIVHYSAEGLLNRIQQEGLSTNFDALWLKSSLDATAFSTNGILANLSNRFTDLNSDITGIRKDWTLLTIDPIITCQKNRFKAINYNDLSNLSSWSVLENDQKVLDVFYASVIFHFGTAKRNEAINYIRKTKKNYNSIPLQDSLNEPVYIGRLSVAKHMRMKSYIPNQYAQGCFYDGHTFAIINQAKNFNNAIQFLEFALKEKSNQKIAKYFEVFPIKDPKERALFTYQNQYPRLHSAAPVKMHRLTRIRKKIIHSIDALVEKEATLIE